MSNDIDFSTGASTFRECENLSAISFNLYGEYTDIPWYAFYQCNNLVIADLEGISSVKANAFNSCSKLSSLNLGNSLYTIGQNAFSYCTNLKQIKIGLTHDRTFSSGYPIMYNSGLAELQLTSTNLYNTYYIQPYAFERFVAISSVVLPETLYTIYDSAFENCINLLSIKIPDNVAFIKASAFLHCNALSSIQLPNRNGGSIVGSWTFAYNNALSSITIPRTVLFVENLYFPNDTIKSRKFRSTDTFIECNNLTSMIIDGTSVSSIPVFYDYSEMNDKLSVKFNNLAISQIANFNNEINYAYNYDIGDGKYHEEEGLYPVRCHLENIAAVIDKTDTAYKLSYDDENKTTYAKIDQKFNVTILQPFSGGGSILGVTEGEYDKGTKLTAYAQPDLGNYFSTWDEEYCYQNGPMTPYIDGWSTNPKIYDIQSDISIQPWFSNNEDDIKNVVQRLNLVSTDNCCLIKNGHTGEFLSTPAEYYEFKTENITCNMNKVLALKIQNCYAKYGSTINIEAKPLDKYAYKFKSWTDGNNQNPRTFYLTCDTEIKPIVEKIS